MNEVIGEVFALYQDLPLVRVRLAEPEADLRAVLIRRLSESDVRRPAILGRRAGRAQARIVLAEIGREVDPSRRAGGVDRDRLRSGHVSFPVLPRSAGARAARHAPEMNLFASAERLSR